jgi:hypothetical protein
MLEESDDTCAHVAAGSHFYCGAHLTQFYFGT